MSGTARQPKEAWDKLAAQFQSELVPRMLQLPQELSQLKMQPGESVTRFAARATELQGQLVAAGAEASDSTVAWRVLMGLSEQYSVVLTVLTQTLPRQFTLDDIVPRLLQAEQQMGSAAQSEEQARFAGKGSSGSKPGSHGGSGSGGNSEPGQGGKSKVRCFHCNKVGHKKFECPRLKKQQQKKARQLSAQLSAVALAASVGQLAKKHLSLGAEAEVQWVVDSGASRHLTPHASLLHNVRAFQLASQSALATAARPASQQWAMCTCV